MLLLKEFYFCKLQVDLHLGWVCNNLEVVLHHCNQTLFIKFNKTVFHVNFLKDHGLAALTPKSTTTAIL